MATSHERCNKASRNAIRKIESHLPFWRESFVCVSLSTIAHKITMLLAGKTNIHCRKKKKRGGGEKNTKKRLPFGDSEANNAIRMDEK